MPDDALLQDTIEVVVENATYEFRIPSYLDEIKIGVRERSILREVEQELGTGTDGSATDSLDNVTRFLVHTAAQFEILLKKASVRWPFSNNDRGQPVVNYRNWPKDSINDAIAAGMAFTAELSRFRNPGDTNGNTPGSEAVASQSDSRQVPVRSRLAQP